jgi:nitroreductase
LSDIIKNETINSILERRSVRVYKDGQLSESQINTLREAALRAPSARNAQPCEVRIVTDRALMKEFNRDCCEHVFKPAGRAGVDDPDYSLYFHAPTYIFIFGDSSNWFSKIDGGIMVENIALAAQSMGLGSVIIGCSNPIFSTEAGKKWLEKLEIPETHEIIICIAVGQKDEKPDSKPRDESKFKLI